jgi:NHLM bacteriocin system ABC transporter ATP-binding protein
MMKTNPRTHPKTNPHQKRDHLDRQMMEETFSSLVAVLSGSETVLNPSVLEDPDQILLAAVGAVGKALGLEICPPAPSEDLARLRNPLDAIARASHIRIRRVTLTDRWWEKASEPLLGYSGELAIALLPMGNGYEAYDPTLNARIPVNASFADTLEPTAYTFYRPFPHLLNAVAMLRFSLRGRLKDIGIILAMGITATLLGMLTPQATGILIDHAIPDANHSLLVQLALGLVASALGSTVFQWVQAITLLRLTTATDSNVEAALWDRLLNLPATFFRGYTVGDLSSRVSSVTQIHQVLSGNVLKTLFSGLFSVLNLGLLVYYNRNLALVAIAVALVYVVITLVSGLLTLRKMRPLLEQQGLLLGIMVQIINGVSKLRVAGAEARAFAYWGKQYRQQLHLVLSTQKIEDVLAAINKVLPALTNALIFCVATQMLQNQKDGSFSIGVFLAFNAAFGSFLGGVTSLSSTVVDILSIVPLWQRAQPILDATSEVDRAKADPGKLSGRFAVERVTFRYQPEGQTVLEDISLRAEPGEFIAVVGPSGSGKSTLFRLLLGFEQPESGRVLYDGQDLAGLDVHRVRRQLGVVLQHGRLNAASIFDNIVGNSLTTLDEAWEAAARAGLAEDIQAMPMGMHTIVSEGGSNLSGGQRQRLLIARALALKPKVLLFDEATSALDNRTQAVVSASLGLLKVTRIAIAHRLSTIRNADRIYVLENGRIVQEGSFTQLVRQKGLFAQLIARQTL